MRRFVIAYTLLLCLSIVAKSQEAVVSGGNYHSNSSGSISWSLGELAIHTLKSGENIITQGFQQTRLAVTSVKEISELTVLITAYPNPTSDHVYLKVEDEAENLHFEVYNTTGKLLRRGRIETNPVQIPFNDQSSAVYFIRVLQGNIPVKTFRVVKL
ncbi:MAG: T9SS type A sorting domain-containing protein [Tenuifilaceae bacterium]|nr:T9SS type A sorting domain-containing protein [Tenuifilaceae bacterium]